MADPIRTQIIDSLKSLMASILVANGYRVDVGTVEVAARDWGECISILPDPWVGIVPYESRVTEYPSRLEHEWRMNIITHSKTPTKDSEDVIDTLHAIQDDVERAIYQDPTLGVDGVIFARLTDAEASEPHPQAAIEQIGSTRTGITVLYEIDRP